MFVRRSTVESLETSVPRRRRRAESAGLARGTRSGTWAGLAALTGTGGGQPAGMLRVVLVEGRDLPAMDKTGFSDPYVCLVVSHGLARHRRRSSTKKQTLNPFWMESWTFEDVPPDAKLTLDVWDQDSLDSDYIGKTVVYLSELPQDVDGPLARWLPLPQGELRVELMYTRARAEPAKQPRTSGGESFGGAGEANDASQTAEPPSPRGVGSLPVADVPHRGPRAARITPRPAESPGGTDTPVAPSPRSERAANTPVAPSPRASPRMSPRASPRAAARAIGDRLKRLSSPALPAAAAILGNPLRTPRRPPGGPRPPKSPVCVDAPPPGRVDTDCALTPPAAPSAAGSEAPAEGGCEQRTPPLEHGSALPPPISVPGTNLPPPASMPSALRGAAADTEAAAAGPSAEPAAPASPGTPASPEPPADGAPLDLGALDVLCCTWNVGNAQPPSAAQLSAEWLRARGAHIVAVGAQECSFKPLPAGYSSCAEWWFTEVRSACGWRRYHTVATCSLGQMHLIVLCLVEVAPYVTRVESEAEATGVAHVIGNKGGLAVALDVCGLSLCFVSSHLAAHQGETERRAGDFAEIEGGIRLRKAERLVDLSNRFHCVLWMGDLNYRVECRREEALRLIASAELGPLRRLDQLRTAIARGDAFAGFEEGQLLFPPTFKLVRGTAPRESPVLGYGAAALGGRLGARTQSTAESVADTVNSDEGEAEGAVADGGADGGADAEPGEAERGGAPPLPLPPPASRLGPPPLVHAASASSAASAPELERNSSQLSGDSLGARPPPLAHSASSLSQPPGTAVHGGSSDADAAAAEQGHGALAAGAAGAAGADAEGEDDLVASHRSSGGGLVGVSGTRRCWRPYDELKRRTPSWCDRVLWRAWPGLEGPELLEYDSSPALSTSDHAPVRARLRLRTPPPPPPFPPVDERLQLTLVLTQLRASGLPEHTSAPLAPDPYVRVLLDSGMHSPVCTAVQRRTLEPSWEEPLLVPLPWRYASVAALRGAHLLVSVMDRDELTEDDSLGHCAVTLNASEWPLAVRAPLTKRGRRSGELHALVHVRSRPIGALKWPEWGDYTVTRTL